MFKNTLCCIVALSFLLQGLPTVADENELRSTQKASGSNSLKVDQSGGTQNTANIYQKTTGGNNQVNVMQVDDRNSLVVNQVTQGKSKSHNELDIYQSYENSITLSQTANYGKNHADISQGNTYGGDNLVNLDQQANGLSLFGLGYSNWTYIVQNGSNNQLVGAIAGENGNGLYDADAIISIGDSAYQYSESSFNVLNLKQDGNHNIVGLHQEANGFNKASIGQFGDNNKVGVYQNNTHRFGSNNLVVSQNGSDLNVGVSMETNSLLNNITITQNSWFNVVLTNDGIFNP